MCDPRSVSTTARPTVQDALRLGRRTFLVGERIDMGRLAGQLGVNRVTLYRWLGSRDRLLVEVIWSLAAQVLAESAAATSAQGPEGIVETCTRFIDTVVADRGMQHWLAEEGEHAMRLLTRHDTHFQPRLIAAVQDLLEDEAQAGRLNLPVDLHDLAYALVRLIESYIYLDLITGQDPLAHRAEPILRLLLRGAGPGSP